MKYICAAKSGALYGAMGMKIAQKSVTRPTLSANHYVHVCDGNWDAPNESVPFREPQAAPFCRADVSRRVSPVSWFGGPRGTAVAKFFCVCRAVAEMNVNHRSCVSVTGLPLRESDRSNEAPNNYSSVEQTAPLETPPSPHFNCKTPADWHTALNPCIGICKSTLLTFPSALVTSVGW